MEKSWVDHQVEQYREAVLKDPFAARKEFLKGITTPEWERDGYEYEGLDNIDRRLLKAKCEEAMTAYKAREAAKIEAERLRNRSATERLSDEVGNKDLLAIDSLEDEYNVVIHRSNEWFKKNADRIYKENGLFVSDHKGYYGTYTKKEMREQFPNDARYETKWSSLKSQFVFKWNKAVSRVMTKKDKKYKRNIGGHSDMIVCVPMLLGFFFLVFVAVFVLGLVIAFGFPALVDLIHSIIVNG